MHYIMKPHHIRRLRSEAETQFITPLYEEVDSARRGAEQVSTDVNNSIG